MADALPTGRSGATGDAWSDAWNPKHGSTRRRDAAKTPSEPLGIMNVQWWSKQPHAARRIKRSPRSALHGFPTVGARRPRIAIDRTALPPIDDTGNRARECDAAGPWAATARRVSQRAGTPRTRDQASVDRDSRLALSIADRDDLTRDHESGITLCGRDASDAERRPTVRVCAPPVEPGLGHREAILAPPAFLDRSRRRAVARTPPPAASQQRRCCAS